LVNLGLSLAEIDALPARDLPLWLIAAHRMAGRGTIGLAQGIGIAFSGKDGAKTIEDLMPDYEMALPIVETTEPEALAAEVANFFGLQIIEEDAIDDSIA
jgi:hypothetical protein